jgi:hypothetical protein
VSLSSQSDCHLRFMCDFAKGRNWTFGEWKAVVVRIHMLQKWNAQTYLRKTKFHTEKKAKWKMNVKAAENSKFSGYHYPAETIFWSKFFKIQISLGVFHSKISHGNESHKIWLFAALTLISLIFRYEILYAKYVDLLDKLRAVKKSQFFTCHIWNMREVLVWWREKWKKKSLIFVF